MLFRCRKTIFPSPRFIFASPKTVFASPNFIFASPKTIFASPNFIFASPKTIFASPNFVFASPNFVFASPKTIFASPNFIFVSPKTAFRCRKIVFPSPNFIWGDPDFAEKRRFSSKTAIFAKKRRLIGRKRPAGGVPGKSGRGRPLFYALKAQRKLANHTVAGNAPRSSPVLKGRRMPPSLQDGFRLTRKPDTACLANFRLSRGDEKSRGKNRRAADWPPCPIKTAGLPAATGAASVS